MLVRRKVRVSLPKLPSNHGGIRFDVSQGAGAAIAVPKGATREVKQLSVDRNEAGQALLGGCARAPPLPDTSGAYLREARLLQPDIRVGAIRWNSSTSLA